MRLAFGMPVSAGEQLEQALSDLPAQRDAARFYLGKLSYLKGDWAEALRVWSRVGGHLELELEREYLALRWQVAIRSGEIPTPSSARLWEELEEWAPVVFYNLGGERARAGERTQARHFYQTLIDDAPRRLRSHPEYLALKDRAHTAAGFTLMLDGELEPAKAHFAEVRLERPEANRTLLGYGWAAAESGNYEEALRPWQALSERSLTDSSVHESLLALPHAYEQLNAPADAMDAYDEAEILLETELNRVVALSETLAADALLSYFRGEGGEAPLTARVRQNWLSLTRETVAFTDNAYLEEWVNQSQFQTQVQALSDLLDQRALLTAWKPKLDHYQALLQEKRELRQHRSNEVERDQLLAQADELKARREQLARRLERIEEQQDYMALADADTQSLHAMVEAAHGRRERLLAAGEDVGDSAERLRVYAGILQWRAAQTFPDNLWQVQKQRTQVDSALQELAERREKLAAIIAENPDIQPNMNRMEELNARIERQVQALDQSLGVRAEALSAELQGHLQEHQKRLNHYLARVRLAAARLQDQALQAQPPAEASL